MPILAGIWRALAALMTAAAFMIVAGFGRLGVHLRAGGQAIAGAFALICAGLTLMDQALPLALLFFAAGLIGVTRASQAGVEQGGRQLARG